MTATIASITGSGGGTSSGNSTQRHVVYAPNSAVWWAFWVDPATSTTLRSAFSSDLVTWTTSNTVTLANALGNSADGRYLSAYVANIGGTDVVHVVAACASFTAYDCRGVLTATSVTWASANSITNANTTSTPSPPDGVSVVLASDGTLILSSATVDAAATSGDDTHTYNATVDTTGSSWTPGTWTTDQDHVTSAIFMRNRSLHALASGNVIALWTADVNPPNNVVYSVISSSSGVVAPANVYGTSVAFSDGTANEYGTVRVSATDIHVVRRTGTNTYEHIRYNGTSWSAGQSIPTQTSLSKNGIALTSDGTNVYMAVIDSAAGNAVQTITWNGSSWGSWTALDNTSATRSNITAAQASAANKAAFSWMENPSGTSFNIRVAGVTTTTAISVSDTATGSDSVSLATITPAVSDTGSGTDTPTLATITPAVSDSATGTDTVSVNTGTTPISVSDSATGTDTPALAADVTPAVSDSGTGTDSVSVNTGEAATPISVLDPGIEGENAGDEVVDGSMVFATMTEPDAGSGAEVQTPTLGVVTAPQTDAGSGSDQASLATITPTLTDAGTGADAPSESTLAVGVGDSGAGTDTLAPPLATSVPITDAGSGVDVQSMTVITPTLADAGSGVDAPSESTLAVGVSDAGTGVDAPAATPIIPPQVPIADAGAGIEFATFGTPITPSVTDAGSGVDATTITTTAPIADTGSGADGALAGSNLPDAGTGADSVTFGTTQTPISDAGVGTDAAPVLAPISPQVADASTGADGAPTLAIVPPAVADTGIGADGVSLATQTLPLADTGTGGEQPGIAAQMSESDTGAGADAIGVLASPAPTDAGVGADIPSVPVLTPAVADAGRGGEQIAFAPVAVAVADTGAGAELVAMSLQVADTATTEERVFAEPTVPFGGPGYPSARVVITGP